MTKLKLTQAWVHRVTSDTTDDIVAVGKDMGPLPSDAEVSAIANSAASTDAVREMVRRKWFSPSGTDDRRAARGRALQQFLFSGRPSRPAFVVATLFRRQRQQRELVDELATLAWLCRVTDKATEKKLQFNAAKLNQRAITHLVRLSKDSSGPRDAIQYLEKLGIRVVIESSLPGMRIDGASFVVPGFGPVIGLTLRYDRLDSFWFTLLHELAHIVLHLCGDSDGVFIDSIEDEDREESEIEAEANAFAKDSFVPRDAWLRSDAFRFATEPAILALAEKFEIHPAVIAGRLRFERKRYQDFSQLLGAGQVRSVLLAE
jgi:HTH-type transcriptional regulator/antitoxin HigA